MTKSKLNTRRLSLMKRTKLFLLDLIFPNKCPFCNEAIKYDMLICVNCYKKYKPLMFYCKKCGKIECQCNKLYRFDKCDVCAVYDSFMQKAILNLKRGRGENLVHFVLDDLCQKIKGSCNISDIYCVVSVPPGINYEYDQSRFIAKMIAQNLGLKTDYSILKRTKVKRPKQHTLTDSQRKKNVKGMYAINSKTKADISGKTILLCDDVLTTGATLSECAKILKDNGAAQVFCCTIAVTEKNSLH